MIKAKKSALSAQRVTRRKVGRSPLADNEIMETLSREIAAFGPAGATFDELRDVIPGAGYDVLQEAIFELLDTTEPEISQFFDKASGHLRLVGVAR